MLLEFAHDSTGELAGWYGGTELFRPPESFEQRCQAVERVSAAGLQAVAKRTFTAGNLSVVAVGPKRGARALGRAVARAFATL